MIERLQIIESRYNEINDLLTKPEIISDVKNMTNLSKEQANLKDAYQAIECTWMEELENGFESKK